LVHKYVEGRAEAKTGKKVKDFDTEVVNDRKRRIYPKEFREAQQRVCSDAFLAMSSRHDQDFVAYFVGSICSVAQYIPPTDYQFLTSVLLTKSDPNPTGSKRLSWEDVKAVAMIAVSACSYATEPRDNQQPRSSS
jgi:CRISPR-associated protein Cmx8